MDELLEYEGLVYGIIQRYTKYFEKDDLYQVGMMGLINAYKKFDSSQNVKFSSYAYYYILGEVKKYIRESGSIKIGRDVLSLNRSVERAREVMRQSLRREPTTTEISLYLEVDESRIQDAQIALQDVRSLDFSFEGENLELYSSIQCTDNGMQPEIMDLRREVQGLDPFDRDLIVARYYSDMTQSETSKKLGVSQVQVSRREGKILEKLRERL